jgi:outer membrane protein
VQELIDQAWRSRPELASLERQVSAIDANLAAVRAGYFPSLVGQANLDIANPNQRFVPNSQEFNTTWDASLILQWSPTAAIQNGATASRVAAQREAVRAQIGALLAGVELDVRGAWVNVQGARAAIDAAGRQLAAAEEAYRVRRERFAAGSAISSDLTDAENDLLRARFALVNAHVDLRVSLARLRRAVGTPERTR